ncbi:LOW QUALITY PROTEIN: olfactory receptor 4C12-like [Pundamilia nyererei]|uniref:LOW QUALITY PROTEIN: olfactory receptor 4C12-like n=1 Tax=Pundamilia nyererei TaxID=303518 RepID=A0A9Y6J930_9CICH|nr:PREDICTED: LOW QUALITY PROTEIN: olfactory receptor 4C12-like [Pundamilia nyererei]
MEKELNVTFLTLDWYTEINKYRYILFFTMFTLYILIICTNSTILYLIFTHKNLHEPMYIFIAALLLNSVLYSTTMYPKLLIDFLSEKQVTTYSACLFQFFMFYTLGGSELPLLTAMAYDRYVAICKPLEYQTIMTKTTVSIFLVVAWLVPACHIAVQAIASAEAKLWDSNIKGIFCNNAVYTLQCQRSRLITVFGVVSLLDLVILPMLFIVFTYTIIFIVSYQSCKEIRKKAAETCLPHLLHCSKKYRTPHAFPNDAAALWGIFLASLNEQMKDQLAVHDELATFEALASLALRIDNRLRERDAERCSKPSPSLFRPATTSTLPPPLLVTTSARPHSPSPEPMEIGCSRLTPEERERRSRAGECFYCGGSGHCIAVCPVRQKGVARR